MDNTEFSTTENHCGGSSSEKLGGMCSNPPAPPAPAPAPTTDGDNRNERAFGIARLYGLKCL